jgi:hypothetical protein
VNNRTLGALLLLLALAPASLRAQDGATPADPSRTAGRGLLSFGAAGEINFFNGDIQDNSTTFGTVDNPPSPGGAVMLEFHALQWQDLCRLNLIGHIGFHQFSLSADDIYKAVGTISVRNKSVDISVLVCAELFPEVIVRPYLSAGLGGLFYDTKKKVSPGVVDRYATYLAGADRVCLTIPAGIGIRATVTRAIDVFAGFQKYYTFTDVLDGWQVASNDNIAVISAGLMLTLGPRPPDEAAPAPLPPPIRVDSDRDGLTDDDETLKFHTNPGNPDSDGDGLSDGDELRRYSTDPLQADTDGDGLTDSEEIRSYGTDPLRKDTDEDGCEDGREVREMKTNPLVIDTDGDGITDCDEVSIYLTAPLVRDTDGDGVDDGEEVRRGLDPLKKNR